MHPSLEQVITNCQDSIASIKEAIAYDQSILIRMSQEEKDTFTTVADHIKERNIHREGMTEAYLFVIASITGDYTPLHSQQDKEEI